MALFFLYLFLLFQAFLLAYGGQLQQVATAYDNRNRSESAKIVSATVQRYYRETGTYPASLSALSSTTGYEFIKTSMPGWQDYATTTGLNDGVWTYSRAVVLSQSVGSMVSTATYLDAANNKCGAAAFATAPDWCGSSGQGTYFWRHESRETATLEMVRERQRLKRLIDKFAKYYNEAGVFPNPGSSAATLPTITSYAGNATNCSGILSWSGVPIDCGDLYSRWGTPTTYNYLSPSHIVLLSKSSIVRNDGTAVYVSMELSL